MTREEQIYAYKELRKNGQAFFVDTYEDADRIITALSQEDGCDGCAFITTEEWEMPCAKCKRNCKDYWRAKADRDEEQK